MIPIGKKEILEETCLSATLSTKNPIWTGLRPGHVVFHVAEDKCGTAILPLPRLWLL